MSVYTFVVSSGSSIGLLAGGSLTQALNWHWIFFINLPIGTAAFLLGLRSDERLHVRGLERQLDRPAGGRLADPGAQLALDLLYQPPDRHRRVPARPPIG